MRVISWNVQGAKRTQVLLELQFLKRTYKPDIIFLLETMVNERNILQLLPRIGFEHFDFVAPNNHSGGLAVLWHNTNVHASLLNKDHRAIHMLVHDHISNHKVIIGGIYAPAQQREKAAFWNHLYRLNGVMNLPWCLIGDFNEMATPIEKRGGRLPSDSSFERLNDFLNTINASTVPNNGSLFTWKKRIHTHLIYERLDRVIGRSDWNTLFPEAVVVHGSFTCSDHCPIILIDSIPRLQRKNFPFRFQNYWSQYQQVQHIVQRQWRNPMAGTSMFSLVQRLKRLKQPLKEWAHTSLRNNHQRLSTNTQKIQQVETQLLDQPESHRLHSWLKRLLVQREKLLLFRQKYWDRFKRKKWLVDGDRNSSYF